MVGARVRAPAVVRERWTSRARLSRPWRSPSSSSSGYRPIARPSRPAMHELPASTSRSSRSRNGTGSSVHCPRVHRDGETPRHRRDGRARKPVTGSSTKQAPCCIGYRPPAGANPRPSRYGEDDQSPRARLCGRRRRPPERLRANAGSTCLPSISIASCSPRASSPRSRAASPCSRATRAASNFSIRKSGVPKRTYGVFSMM